MRRLLFLILLLLSLSVDASMRQKIDLGWQFCRGDKYGELPREAKWQDVSLPHDWSITLPYDKNTPAGNDGGYLPTGVGYYKKSLIIKDTGLKYWLYFEGVYMNSTVKVNGKTVGGQPYGYTSFYCDITNAVRKGNNLVEVKVDNSAQKNCRWYSGSGIYRPVWLISKPYLHIDNWGVQVHTKEASTSTATIEVKTKIVNETSRQQTFHLSTDIAEDGCDGKPVRSSDVTLSAGEEKEIIQEIKVERPKLWDILSPDQYTADVSIESDGKTIDAYSQRFGIRKISYSSDKGFFLNGRRIYINGGCIHHDNGILGAAAYDRAEVRKIKMMRNAGFNAVRTSHNPPSESLLKACDQLGMLVIDEAFDGWRDAKNTHDYHELFDKYWQQDIDAMVLRDINHPSIIAWSIGNEVIERKKIEVVTTAHKLAAEIRKYDDRPITSALASWDKDWEIYDPLAAEHDIVGYNYLIQKHASDHQRVPGRIMWQTESYPRDAFNSWKTVHDNSYFIGDFVWTGIDYIGESGIGRYWYDGQTPGEHYQRPLWPCTTSYCGDIDLTGWRKPISHYRNVLWNDSEKLYMAVREPDGYHGKINTGLWAVWPTWESWNWPGWEGKNIEVEVISRYPKVKLYLNDRLVGEKAVGLDTERKAVFTLPYEPGALRAEGVQETKVAETRTLSTAGSPYAVRLHAENQWMFSNGEDIAFVQAEIMDKEGRLCPDAEVELTAKISGPATLAAFGTGNFENTVNYSLPTRKTWKGRALIILRSTTKKGKVTLSVGGKGLNSNTIRITSF